MCLCMEKHLIFKSIFPMDNDSSICQFEIVSISHSSPLFFLLLTYVFYIAYSYRFSRRDKDQE